MEIAVMNKEKVETLREQFVHFALNSGVLMFGEFLTKAGRLSPYFFNAGRFSHGSTLGKVAQFYAQTLLAAECAHSLQFDMLFGPAYKGIPLVAATAIALAGQGRDVSFAYNRKEKKDHGEGGAIVGALRGKVVIVDDVISAGTSVRESVEMIRAAGAQPAAVLIALDRMERGGNAQQILAYSAAQEVEQQYRLPVIAIATLRDILSYLTQGAHSRDLATHARAIDEYRKRYGVEY